MVFSLISEVWAGANDNVNCSVECPDGTRVSNIELSEFRRAEASNGTFLYASASCESFCEPIVPCVLPNVPVVTQAGFTCQPLVGLDDFEPVDEIDFTFTELWDEEQATP
jgi:hypothetical protein